MPTISIPLTQGKCATVEEAGTPPVSQAYVLKQCFKCSEVKYLSEFYEHPQMADGHLNKCKKCTKSDVRTHRATHPHVREYDRSRSKLSHRVTQRREINARLDALDPTKRRCRQLTSRAVRRGVIEKRPCESCGSIKVEAHHSNYDDPLNVTWLCALCHRRLHAQIERSKELAITGMVQ